jgi:hypothetical protein
MEDHRQRKVLLVNKPRGDSKLKMLPRPAQEKIISWLNTGTQADTIRRVKKDLGVSTSAASLSDFFQWFHLSRDLSEAASFADRLRADLRATPGLDLDDEKLSKAAQVAFELQAMKNRDAKLFIGLRRLRQNRELLAFEREKFQFDAAAAALAALPALRAIAGDKSMSDQDKISAARKKLFGEVPA